MYFVYVIRCDDNSLYTGITTDLNKRFSQHRSKAPVAAKYTKSRQALTVEALWSAPDRSTAQKLEYYIKKLPKSKKEQLIKDCDNLNEYMPDILDVTVYNAKPLF